MDIQTALITAVKCFIRVFYGFKPDWIECLDRSTGIGSDRIYSMKILDWIRIAKISGLINEIFGLD